MNVNKRKNGCVIPVHVKNQYTFTILEQNKKLDLWKWGVENMVKHLNESSDSNKNQIWKSWISHFFICSFKVFEMKALGENLIGQAHNLFHNVRNIVSSTQYTLATWPPSGQV